MPGFFRTLSQGLILGYTMIRPGLNVKKEGIQIGGQLFFYTTDLGSIGIAEQENTLTDLYFPGEVVPKNLRVAETAVLEEAGNQLRAYLAGRLQNFTLPLAPAGTAFQQSVWEKLCAIPYGETRSYREIAQSLGKPGAARAVGQANHNNPLPIFIPCHRVIGASGKLVGYGGGLHLKEYLLRLESAKIRW